MGKHKTGIDLYRAAAAIERGQAEPHDDSGETRSSKKTPPITSDPKVTPAARKPTLNVKPAQQADGEQPKKDLTSGIAQVAGVAGSTNTIDRMGTKSPGFIKIAREELAGGTARAARLLLLLGKDEAASVMSKLTPDQAESLARQIAAVKRIDTVEARSILEGFGYDIQQESIRRVRGGVDSAREILTAAFGDKKAAKIIAKAVPESLPKPFAFFSDLSFNQVMSLIRKEPPHTLALIFSYIDPALASRILESLPDNERAAVVLRMARTQKVSREVLMAVESTMQDKRRRLGKDDSEEMDGRSALAEILRYMDIQDERRLLYELGESDESLAEAVKEKLFTMDTVLHLRDRDLQNELSGMAEKEIALILKGQPVEIQERINASLSSRRRLLVADESDIMGKVKRSEADAASRLFLERLRTKEEEGTYIIIREEDLI